MVSGKIADNGTSWNDITTVNGGETPAMQEAKAKYNQYLTTKGINTTSNMLVNAANGNSNPKPSDPLTDLWRNLLRSQGIDPDKPEASQEEKIAALNQTLR